MKARFDWSDLALFAAVARAGGLSPAAAVTGVSPATLSRRMRAFEQQSGRPLFLHGAAGYQPTGEGRALLDRIARMEAAATDIDRWHAHTRHPVRVRISAGTWTAQALADHLAEIWTPDAIWVPEFLQAHAGLDLARREIDIGIRNRRPESPRLAGRRTGTVRYAAYATGPDVAGWIGASQDAAATRSAAWVRDHHASDVVTTANAPPLALAMAEAGIGRVVLPTFVGDARPGLIRIGPLIEELASEEWLVCHHDTRHDPPIRAALEALARYLTRASSSNAAT